MLLLIAAALVVLWIVGFLVFHLAGALIHLLLLAALAFFVIRLVSGSSSDTRL